MSTPAWPLHLVGRRVAEMRDAGLSLAEMIYALKKEGLPTPPEHRDWDKRSVRDVLERWDAQG